MSWFMSLVNPSSMLFSGSSVSNITEGIIGFLWSIIKYIYYGGRSVLYLFNTIFDNITGIFDYCITYLYDMFDNLSLFMGSSVTFLVGMFILVFLLLIFQFLIRLFTGKYHLTGRR